MEIAKLASALVTTALLLGACTQTQPEAIEVPHSPSSTITTTASTTDFAEAEMSFLAATKAGLRTIPDLPYSTDRELVSFGYEMCDRIESAVSDGIDPTRAAEEALLDALLPTGQIDGGRGTVIRLRATFQRVATEYFCRDPRYRAWSDAFDKGYLEALQALIDTRTNE